MNELKDFWWKGRGDIAVPYRTGNPVVRCGKSGVNEIKMGAILFPGIIAVTSPSLFANEWLRLAL